MRLPAFCSVQMDLERPVDLRSDPSCFWILSVIAGTGRSSFGLEQTIALEQTSVVIIPAAIGEFRIEPAAENGTPPAMGPNLNTVIVAPLRDAGFPSIESLRWAVTGRGTIW